MRSSRLSRLTLGAAVYVIAVGLAGCSPTTYKPAVDDFATASVKASTAYLALRDDMIAADLERRKQRTLRRELQIRPLKGDCGDETERCRLEAVDRDGKVEPLVTELPGINAALTGITDYAAALQAVVNADTASKVNASLAAASASINTMAASLAKIPGGETASADTAAFATPVGAAAGWLAGQYVIYLQIDALREAATKANPVIKTAGHILSSAHKLAVRQLRRTSAARANAARNAYRDSPRDAAALDRFIAASADDDRVRTATHDDPFTAMVEAHDKLTQRLNGKDISQADLTAVVKDFSQRAEALRKIVADIQAARDKLKKTNPKAGS